MVRKSDLPCRFYINYGSCKNGSHCLFSHGFDSFGRIEMQIRELLHMRNGFRVPVADLPGICSELYIKLQQYGWDGNHGHLMSLLWRLHTICLIYDSYGCYVILLEDAPLYLGYSYYNSNVMDADSEAHQIYITFSADAEGREICTEENVHRYFSQYGPVLSVKIPRQRSFGFVRFQYPETVRLLLSNWDPQVPHFIFGAGLRVNRYISYNLRNPAGNHGPNGPDGVPGHVPNVPDVVPGHVPNVPEEVPGHMPNGPDEVPGHVPGVRDGDAAQQDMDEIAASLPDVDCFY